MSDFLAVRHSVLNGNSYDVGELVDDTLKLNVPGRTIVPCFEGDLIQTPDEVVFTHQNYVPLTSARFKKLRENGLAATLTEVLDKISEYTQKNNQRVVMCLEPKFITTADTINTAVAKLNEYGIKDAYFDSFFGDKLDYVETANLVHETSYVRSHHLMGNVGGVEFVFSKSQDGRDIATVPYNQSFGFKGPVIYGAVGSAKVLEKIADNPDVKGAYARLNEGSGMKGLMVRLYNSIRNTKKERNIHLRAYQ